MASLEERFGKKADLIKRPYLSPSELGYFLGFTKRSVLYWIDKGTIFAYKDTGTGYWGEYRIPNREARRIADKIKKRKRKGFKKVGRPKKS
jgi:hypothetical protein